MNRYDQVFCKASGSRELDRHEDGEWIRYEDVEPAIMALRRLVDKHASNALFDNSGHWEFARVVLDELDAVPQKGNDHG
jgi:hypothetical protein